MPNKHLRLCKGSLIALSVCASLVAGCGPQEKRDIGPFVVEKEVSHYLRWRYEEGGHLFDRIPTADFRIKHAGKPVIVSGQNGTADKFGRVFFLKDAPRPAILAVTRDGTYLITEESGQAQTRNLEGSLAIYQWLDEADGQPGSFKNPDWPSDAPYDYFLSGGRWLLLNGKTVLNLDTLTSVRFDIFSWETVKTFGGYDVNPTSAPGVPALGFSPDRSQIVFMGEKSDSREGSGTLYALVAVDFARSKAYSVPFDQAKTRLDSPQEATAPWVRTYFEWKKDADGKDLLTLRDLK